MFQEHYLPQTFAYFIGLGGWLAAARLLPELWPRQQSESFQRPWKEVGIALLGAIGIIGMGQLWGIGIRLPEEGTLGPLLASINQVIIFAPILLMIVIRRHPLTSAWLPRKGIFKRLLVGIVLAGLAIVTYSLLRENADAPWLIWSRIWRYENIDLMVQVFLEDLTIAILFVRFAGAIGNGWASFVVACLFAAGHIPAMLSQGDKWLELIGLFRDAGLGVAVILILQRSRDVIWFWCIHFCLDMTQFARISGAA
jgi:hypothetical protein